MLRYFGILRYFKFLVDASPLCNRIYFNNLMN